MSFLGGYHHRLGFGPSAELMTLDTAAKRNLFIHEAYGPRIDAGTEFFVVVPMTKDFRPLSSNVVAEGTKGAVSFTIGQFLRPLSAMADKGLTQFFMAHNHPSGNPAPSQDDIQMTATIGQYLANYRLTMVDHIITTARVKTFSSMAANFPELFPGPQWVAPAPKKTRARKKKE